MIALDRELPAAVADWLATALPAAAPPLRCERISGGYSMLTYRLLDSAGRCWVLRHPPAGHTSGKAHDTDREVRVMSALAGSAVPVPRLAAVGAAADPLGLPCHITEFVPGFVLADATAAARDVAPAALRTATEQIVDVLATLHSLDPDAVGLGDFGPRSGYVARQLHRWRSVIDAAARPETAAAVARLHALATVIETDLPTGGPVRIVHGDYRLGNAIVGPDGQVRAILDWELASLGDPLADLAALVAFWRPPAVAMLGDEMPTTAPGAITVEEVIDRYRSRSGVPMDDFWVYDTFASWRLACTALRAHARFASGAMHDQGGLERFRVACGSWIDAAERAAAAR
ncbi:phosphotransferase family protein [Nocardia sp. BMG111209]|uniref:phosphotransferase family protein n=1 Tax=Nocardia sp. BMG111209 TaxID=1160137 RepID=UPI00037F2AFC|nr:phosphotransferase family protein [Nocardia sp. BMG111209]